MRDVVAGLQMFIYSKSLQKNYTWRLDLLKCYLGLLGNSSGRLHEVLQINLWNSMLMKHSPISYLIGFTQYSKYPTWTDSLPHLARSMFICMCPVTGVSSVGKLRPEYVVRQS